MSLLTVRVPASTSNLGAGFDCVGLALDLWLEARLVPGTGPPVYSGTVAALREEEDLVLRALGEDRAATGGHHLEVHSDIPVSRGLGSSGAAVVAGLALAGLLDRTPLDSHALFNDARRLEGHPDNVAPAIYGGLVLATAGEPVKLALHPGFGVACAIPNAGIDTARARKLLPARVSRSAAVTQAANAASLILGLTRGERELVRHGMVDRIAVPKRASLVDGFENAVRAGIDAGALGVTLSGSGSTLLAICPTDTRHQVADAMAAALTAANNSAEPRVLEVSDRGFTEGVAG